MIVGWARFADGEIHELSAEEMREYDKTRGQAVQSVRMYARYRGLNSSIIRTPDGGIRFRIWDEQGTEDLSAYLPADVVARDREDGEWLPRIYSPRQGPKPLSHHGCTHPKTPVARQRCRHAQGRLSPSVAELRQRMEVVRVSEP